MRPREEIELLAADNESKVTQSVDRDMFRKLDLQLEVLLDIRQLLQKQPKVRKRTKKEDNKHRSTCSVCNVTYMEWVESKGPIPCNKGREHRWKRE